MDRAAFIANFESAIDGITPGSVALETEFQKLPQWDSLALLLCVSVVDSEYGVRIAGREVNQCRTIADLCDLIEAKKAGLGSAPA